jgi:voltage-gated potassium channel
MLRVFRLFRVVVVVRALQARGPAQIADDLSVSRAAATFFTTIFLVILVLEISGMLILDAESGIAGANIRTPSDALWWGYVTITTVGYGDRFPVTLPGRVIGIFLLTAGVALFSVFTGFIANAFLAPRRRPIERLRGARRNDPLAELEAIRRLVVEQDDRSRELKGKLDDLERALVARGATGAPAGGDAPTGASAGSDEERMPAR